MIECADDPDEFAIVISDDGPGMAELHTDEKRSIESLPVVVKHVANSSAVFTPGTGLRFVTETIAAHGGISTVEQSVRGGSRFSLTFRKQPVG